MSAVRIQTNEGFSPVIYAYSTPEIARHAGWVKIGMTEKQSVEDRVRQQVGTADVKYKIEWEANALYEGGSDEGAKKLFSDRDFHRYLESLGVERTPDKEWFHIDGQTAFRHFCDFRLNRGIVKGGEATAYELRAEQEAAVKAALAQAQAKGGQARFLWNAKPRFGKTLAVYELVKRLDAKNVLVVTSRPAVGNSWYADYAKFLTPKSGYAFVSRSPGLKGKTYVVSPEDFAQNAATTLGKDLRRIEFESLQDVKGAKSLGGEYEKHGELALVDWDLIVFDESHEGVDTIKTDLALRNVRRKFTLYLSGTPFKAISKDQFAPDEVFTWSYADEQKAKKEWSSESRNPYADLPQLNLYTYQMSEIVREEIERGKELDDGRQVEYAFDMNLFFATKANKEFEHAASVDKFLDALTTQEKYPFSTPEMRDELRHTLWLLDRVDSAKALARKLAAHPVFKEYEIVLAAGDGKLDEQDPKDAEKAFARVQKAIKEHDKTITLTVGQLTTGVTVPEWSAVLMLSNVQSPALYMQTAFRAQNPRVFSVDGRLYRKERAYVFDFDPARTLKLYESFANDLDAKTVDGRGALDERRENVRVALNFFPVIGEDDAGEMILLDAEKVLAIPRKIRARDVVERGFRSNFLFQNVGVVFHAPIKILELIQKLPIVKETKDKKPLNLSEDTKDELQIDPDGEVRVAEEIVIGAAQDLQNKMIYGETEDPGSLLVAEVEKLEEERKEKNKSEDATYQEYKKLVEEKIEKEHLTPITNAIDEQYGAELRPADRKRIQKTMKANVERNAGSAALKIANEVREINKERDARLEVARTASERAKIVDEAEALRAEAIRRVQDDLAAFYAEERVRIARLVEEEKRRAERDKIEGGVKDRLRGFSRTIPSFLMAYGDEKTTLQNFDAIVPPDVFQEVAGITIEEFRMLRDGIQEDGKVVFPGGLFDPIVFNDAVQKFLEVKRSLAKYFEDDAERDIFDYIPSQRTNQIFTPKKVVIHMVDLLEQESPGCFDQPDKTFADLYMKSGLYIAEIVKRLYRSPTLKRLYPDSKARLRHIFAKQVYGLAPTEIIYRIASNYILGFDENGEITEHNLRQVDALKYAKEGTLQKKIDELFG